MLNIGVLQTFAITKNNLGAVSSIRECPEPIHHVHAPNLSVTVLPMKDASWAWDVPFHPSISQGLSKEQVPISKENYIIALFAPADLCQGFFFNATYSLNVPKKLVNI